MMSLYWAGRQFYYGYLYLAPVYTVSPNSDISSDTHDFSKAEYVANANHSINIYEFPTHERLRNWIYHM